jgi:uncharacterized surface protein with fasciclin (FAS1) repeats
VYQHTRSGNVIRVKGPRNFFPAKVVQADMRLSNTSKAIVHVIDNVLLY